MLKGASCEDDFFLPLLNLVHAGHSTYSSGMGAAGQRLQEQLKTSSQKHSTVSGKVGSVRICTSA